LDFDRGAVQRFFVYAKVGIDGTSDFGGDFAVAGVGSIASQSGRITKGF
jgi:hypothetical protein